MNTNLLEPSDSDHIVFRFSPEVPTDPRLDGVWFDRSRIPKRLTTGPPGLVARPTGTFEFDDGRVAEVWLVTLA